MTTSSYSSKKEVLMLKPNESDYNFSKSVQSVEIKVEWSCWRGGICDLDVLVYIYDENARFVEKLNFDKPVSKDKAFTLLADMGESMKEAKSHEEQVHINLSKISSTTSSAIIFIDGGSRNFQFAKNITLHASKKTLHDDGSSNFSISLSNIQNSDDDLSLFQSSCSPKKDYEGLIALVLHKVGFHEENGEVMWSCKAILEPILVSSSSEKDKVCDTSIINMVPALHQYRPKLFPSVQAICAQLSSTSLPNLKKSFLANAEGLALDKFTDVLFRQLFEVAGGSDYANNGLMNTAEAEYTVAMLHELFGQIDYNGDGCVDWDEFTTFCIYTGLITDSRDTSAGLDNYVIEYTDDKNLKDTINKSLAPLSRMLHVPSVKKLLVVNDVAQDISIMTERFDLYAKLSPRKHLDEQQNLDKNEIERLKVLDVVYIDGKDLICYSCSDHSIVFCKELQGHPGKKQVTYKVYNRINHHYLHVKLCWSKASEILCSVNVENTIYGWKVDSTSPLFQISRHKQKITDFISLDEHGLFATCSLDKRIKLWSQSTRRMKGVLVGHKRGIRFLSHAKTCLLSAGFECEARAWDIDLREQTLTLRGHRHSISACKVMCRDDADIEQENELQGLTVDQSGEFRLWDLYVKKGTDCAYAPTLLIFNSRDENQAQVNFLAIPYDDDYSNGQYSNVIVGTYCMQHFRPEKNLKEFVPPSCMIYSETNCCILTSCGHDLLKYDIITGRYLNCFSNLAGGQQDITCLCMDGEFGRRVFVGFSNGDIILINFATGQILSTCHAHTKGVSCISLLKSECGEEDMIYSGSADGTIRILSENNGEMVILSTLEHACGDRRAVGNIVTLEYLNVIIASSTSRCWGIWHKQSLKKVFLYQEQDPISQIVVVGGGGAPMDAVVDYESALKEVRRQTVVLACCLSSSIRVYCIDLQNLKNAKAMLTHILLCQDAYVTNCLKMTYPSSLSTSLNYRVTSSKTNYGDVILACTDSGKLFFHDIKDVYCESVDEYHDFNPSAIEHIRQEYEKDNYNGGAQSTDSVINRNEDSNDSNGDQQECGYESDGSDASNTSLFSLTSAMGTVNVQGDDSNINVTSIKLAKTLTFADDKRNDAEEDTKNQCQGDSKQKLSNMKILDHLRQLRRSTTVEISSTGNSNIVMNTKDVKCIDPVVFWTAHCDSIVVVEKLGDSGCFATLSLDGYHRVWNLQQDCLGCLPLPNLTEDMKTLANKGENSENETDDSQEVEWLFLKEKIPVKPVHVQMARKLLDNIMRSYETKKKNRSKVRQDDDLNRRNACDAHDQTDIKTKAKIPTNNEERNGILMSLTTKESKKKQNVGGMSEGSRALLQASALLTEKVQIEESNCDDDSSLPNINVRQKTLIKVNNEIKELKRKLDKKSSSPLSSIASKSPTKIRKNGKKIPSNSSNASSVGFLSPIKTVYDTNKEWNDAIDFVKNPVNAFSTTSLQEGCKDGLLDNESMKTLRVLNDDQFKLKAFDRVVPGIQLRNVALTASFQFPDADVNHTELSFGQQKHMYKNANHVINNKNKVSSISSNMNARHSLAMLRLKYNISNVGPMTKQTDSAYSDDIALPSIALDEGSEKVYVSVLDEISKLEKSEEEKKRKKKKPSEDKLKKILQKVTDAEIAAVPSWESDYIKSSSSPNPKKMNKQGRRGSTNQHSLTSIMALERKLTNAIHLHHSDVNVESGKSNKKITLTNRDLVPHYKVQDVYEFLSAFFRVDTNCSGYLDLEEWVDFFRSLNDTMSPQSVRQLFTHVDHDGDGVISLHELIPVIFAEASPSQLSLIKKYIDEEVTRNMKQYNKQQVSKCDIRLLFEAYDPENIGYIKIQFIRDKLTRFKLPVAAQLAFNEKMRGIEDDDMVNLAEFTRMFMTYLTYDGNEDM